MRNAERLVRTREALLSAARRLFGEHGFAASGTEDILAAAGVTRGALYHHFRDKKELFEAVCVVMSLEAMEAIKQAVAGIEEPIEALEAGSAAWIGYVMAPGVRRALLLDAPSVLGMERWVEIDAAHGFQLLRAGVEAALEAGAIRYIGRSEDLATFLNGALNAIVLRGDGAEERGAPARQEAAVQLIRTLARR